MNKHITDSKNKFNLQQGVDLGRKPVASNVAISKVSSFLHVKETTYTYIFGREKVYRITIKPNE